MRYRGRQRRRCPQCNAIMPTDVPGWFTLCRWCYIRERYDEATYPVAYWQKLFKTLRIPLKMDLMYDHAPAGLYAMFRDLGAYPAHPSDLDGGSNFETNREEV